MRGGPAGTLPHPHPAAIDDGHRLASRLPRYTANADASGLEPLIELKAGAEQPTT